MTASRKNTARSSLSKARSDMARVDAHVIQPHEYDELPDLSGKDPDEGLAEFAGVAMRGRPSLGHRAKQSLSLRLDPDIIAHYKAKGPGWQTRMNNALRKSMTQGN